MGQSAQRPITVVGMAADGTLDPSAVDVVADAQVVLGGARHLALLPGIDGQLRLDWPVPLRDGLSDVLSRFTDQKVVALASGDPLVAGIATTLIDLLGSENVTVIPAVSSVALARARMRWAAETVTVLRDHRELSRHLAHGVRIIVLSADETAPEKVAHSLVAHGFGRSRLTVLSHLGSPDERSIEVVAAEWQDQTVPRLNLVAVDVVGGPGLGYTTGLPDDAFEHDGQITKRDIRASALARLLPGPRQLLWDVGAGAGSVAIEWLRSHSQAQAIAIEGNEARVSRIERNALSLGVPRLTVVCGKAPGALAELPEPDAIFVGGGATQSGVLDTCWAALRPGGRLVVHGVTAETEALLIAWHSKHGGELSRLRIEHAEPLGGFTGWTPGRAVTQWAVQR